VTKVLLQDQILFPLLVHHQRYPTRDDANWEVVAFIEGFYNRQRLHQSLGYLTLLEFERRVSDS